MNTRSLLVALIGILVSIRPLSALPGQAPNTGVERQLQSRYRAASVDANGTVVRAGTVLVVAQDGIKANPPSGDIYWYNSRKPGNRIKYSVVFESLAGELSSQVRQLQVGEKVLLTRLQVKPSDVTFYVQTYADNPNDSPYRACLVFQFQKKGFVEMANLKAIQDSIDEVFTLDNSSETAAASPPPGEAPGDTKPGEAPQATAVTLTLPATYVSAQAVADQLHLKADHSFSLQEAGQTYQGHFSVNGATLELTISDSNTKTAATLQGNILTDSSGQTWALRQPPAGTARGTAMLQNDDVIKMVKSGINDLFIIGRINGSECQFDTSTDGLIRLKQNGVSAAVLKAMLATGK